MAELADILTARVGAAWRGTFEAHLTVATPRARHASFAQLCAQLGVKCILIELAAGVHRAQPMTSTHHRGALADVAAEVLALAARLDAAGFPVVRVKLEALLGAEPGPIVDPARDPHGYFEFHAKVRVVEPTAMLAVCERHGA
ncbi:MAG: hypothetical protein NT062_38030, partial [Proteobacteria bacterium]|nr:hypothetical protein [Pseudomonadota bacterium]